MAWYKAGGATFTNGSATVTGSGTLWVDVGTLNVGDIVAGPDGKFYEVLTISSNTGLTLASNYLGSTTGSVAYAIMPIGLLPSALALQVKSTLNTANTALTSAVLFSASQGLTTTNQGYARANIAALGAADVGQGRLSKSVAGGVDVTLTAAEAANQFIELTGTITANINVIVPAAARLFFIYNGTSGAFTLTVKTLSGTGFAIPQFGRLLAECDATNIVNPLTHFGASLTLLTPSGNGTLLTLSDQGWSSGVGNNAGALQFFSGGTSTERARIDAVGNLGLGVTPSTWGSTSKAQEFSIYGAVSSNSGTGGAYYSNNAIMSTNNASTGWVYKNSAGATLYSQTMGQQAWSYAAGGTAGAAITWSLGMAMNASGNLCIGANPSTNTASVKCLQVLSTTFLSGDGAAVDWSTSLSNNAAPTGAGNHKYDNAQPVACYRQASGSHQWMSAAAGTPNAAITWTQTMTLDSAGNLIVPAMYATTVTTPRNVFIDSTGKMGGISSVRASKGNIVPLSSAAWVGELSPVTFQYKKRDEAGEYTTELEDEVQYGLIAEDVEAVKPEFCIYVDGKLAGVHYDRMISPLIKAVQELLARVAALEAA